MQFQHQCDSRYLLMALFVAVIFLLPFIELRGQEELEEGSAKQQMLVWSSGELRLITSETVDPGSTEELPYCEITRMGLSPFFQTAVCINTADKEVLMTLPGIGPAMAQRILDYRERHGVFNSAEDLMKVNGIGPKTIQRLNPLMSFER